MPVKCTNCGGAHPSWDCSKPTKSTAARKDVPLSPEDSPFARGKESAGGAKAARDIGSNPRHPAGTQALPVDTNLIVGVDPASKDFGAKVIGRVMEDGRIEILSLTHSKAQFNKAEYQRKYMADQRTIKRLGLDCSVKEWRESLK